MNFFEKPLFVCAGAIEILETALPAGVGSISGVNLTKFLMQNPNFSSVIFLGSAGAYDFSLPPLTPALTAVSAQIEPSFLQQKSYSPILQELLPDEKNTKNFQFFTQIYGHISPHFPQILKNPATNSSNFITIDENLSREFVRRKILLENMEFFFVQKAANACNLPCLGVLCVSNFCNFFAHQNFIENHAKTLEILRQILKILSPKTH